MTVPLVNAFKPSYAFVGGYLVLSTSDKLLKQTIDVTLDPSTGLSAEALFKQGGAESAPSHMISFVKMGEIARQSKALVDWADHWFSLKIQQADADEAANRQKLQALTETIQVKDEEFVSDKERLDNLRREKSSLEAQVQVAAVAIESKNTLSQEGAVQEASVPDEVRPEKLLEYKKSQVAAMELEVDGLQKDIEAMKARQPDLTDDLNDFESQKLDAQKFRYYIDDVVVPVLNGLEALVSQKITTTVKDEVIDSEMFLTVE